MYGRRTKGVLRDCQSDGALCADGCKGFIVIRAYFRFAP